MLTSMRILKATVPKALPRCCLPSLRRPLQWIRTSTRGQLLWTKGWLRLSRQYACPHNGILHLRAHCTRRLLRCPRRRIFVGSKQGVHAGCPGQQLYRAEINFNSDRVAG